MDLIGVDVWRSYICAVVRSFHGAGAVGGVADLIGADARRSTRRASVAAATSPGLGR
ncbi:hypothetical protein [Streptosporangium carneum]